MLVLAVHPPVSLTAGFKDLAVNDSGSVAHHHVPDQRPMLMPWYPHVFGI